MRDEHCYISVLLIYFDFEVSNASAHRRKYLGIPNEPIHSYITEKGQDSLTLTEINF